MATILVVGMAVVDFLFEVPSMPETAEKYVAYNAQVVGGGGAANAACAMARLGATAMLAARVGDDMFGDLIIEDLKKHEVDCSLTICSENGRSSYSSVLVDANGERQIVNYRGSGLSDDVSRIKRTKPHAVMADTRWKAGAVAALQLAKDNHIPGVLDAEAPLEPELLSLASHTAFSRQGLESLVGALDTVDSIEAALREVERKYSGWVAMTDGAQGVYSLGNSQFIHQSAATIDVIDTLGAGDVWHGAFTYCLACGNDEKTAVVFANGAATLSCAQPGGGRASPTMAEVERFIN